MHLSPTIVFAIVIRVLVAICTRSFFQPDEYFQSLEPAHKLVFGYGMLTWEWLSPRPIRSILYPALNVPVYWILKVLGLDDTKLLILAPKVLHGLLAAGTDIWVRELARKVVGEGYVSAAYFVSLTSVFHALALSRSLSNSFETTLTTIALSYFPWNSASLSNRRDLQLLLCFAAFACCIRITNVVIWVFLLSRLLWHLRLQPRLVRAFLADVFAIGSIAVLILFATDSMYYGRPVLTPLSFLLTNASSVSLFYGTSPWHYYLTQGLPILCGPTLPFVLHDVWRIIRPSDTERPAPPQLLLLALVGWTLGIYSLAGHKEWRFLHPILPLLHILAAKSLVDLHHTHVGTAAPRPSRPDQKRRLPIRPGHMALLLLSIPLSIYVCLFHSHAQISVTRYLHDLPSAELKSVGFLMPCHSTPGQAYLHRVLEPMGGRLWALGCEPPLNGQDVAMYKDQTDVFYDSPYVYLATRFPPHVDATFPPSPYPRTIPGTLPPEEEMVPWVHEWPSHLVFFGALLKSEAVEALLERLGYREVWQAGNGLEEDWRRRGGVRVWRWEP